MNRNIASDGTPATSIDSTCMDENIDARTYILVSKLVMNDDSGVIEIETWNDGGAKFDNY